MIFIDFSKKILKYLGVTKKPKLFFEDVGKLYNNTLYYSEKIRPWAFKNGKYLALELRYDFVNQYLNNPSEYNYRDTDYYKFISDYSAGELNGIYEGCSQWAYSNPDNLCARFQAMINSIMENIRLYNILNVKNYRQVFSKMYENIIDFEKNNMVEIKYIESLETSIRKESKQYLSDKKFLKETIENRFIGHLIPTGIIIGDNLVVKNGCHRLAIIKVLKEKNQFQNDFALFIEGKKR